MKKLLLLILLSTIFLTGCNKMTYNTPTSKVEEFLGKYQKLDKDILIDLKNMIDKEEMIEEEKKEYQTLLEKQYQNLSYKIKNKIIKKDTATVDVEIEVLDYSQAISKANKTCEEENIIACKIEEMKLINSKVKHDITFTLNQEEGKWIIEKLNNDDVKKLHGLY